MIDFKHRSYKKELLDSDDIPFKDIAENMRELNFINANLGGHLITLEGFKKLTGDKTKISVCEIGCGGGDNLKSLALFCKQKKIQAKFTGIDINAECISYARKKLKIASIVLIESDYKKIKFENLKPDIIFSSLFCHHFTNEDLVQMIKWMKNNCNVGFFINDLQRHPIAYYFIKYAANIFSKSYLVKNDAPLSVLRGFKKDEWLKIFSAAGISNFSIKWKWAFRYLITVPV